MAVTFPNGPEPVRYLDELAAMLLNCLCEAVQLRPEPPQHCCLRVGDQVIHDADVFTDLCCEGLAYVTVGVIYPVVDSFPEKSIVRQADQICSFPSWGVGLKAGILRCLPTGETLSMPTCEAWTQAALQNIYDAQSLASAACCFKQTWLSDERGMGLSIVIEDNATGSTQGGCIERAISITVQTTVCPTC